MGSVLCVDIGGSRIKAAVLSQAFSLATLQSVPLVTLRSLGWLNQSLPQLFSAGHWASVVSRLDQPFDSVAVGVPGQVRNGVFERDDLDVPSDLAQRCQRIVGKEVTLVNDAAAWLVGACAYGTLVANEPRYPALALIFGTGVGIAFTSDGLRFETLELSTWPHRWPTLAKASGVDIEVPWQVHDIVGNRFFEWVAASQRHWDYTRVRDEFSRRVAAFAGGLVAAAGGADGAAGPRGRRRRQQRVRLRAIAERRHGLCYRDVWSIGLGPGPRPGAAAGPAANRDAPKRRGSPLAVATRLGSRCRTH